MSLARTLMDYGRDAARYLRRESPDAATERRVLVLERTGAGEWNAVQGEIGGDRVTIVAAQTLGRDGGRARLGPLGNGAEVVLVSNSHKSVCRFLDLVDAPPDQMRRMVALRLETELPYPVGDCTWVCERQENGGPGSWRVLVVATATAEIAQAEEELRAEGLRCRGIEYDAAGLAELAVAGAAADETVAIVRGDATGVTFVVARSGALCYARHIPVDRDGPEDRIAHIANEVGQSVYDYELRTKGAPPARVVVAGADAGGLIEALGPRLGIPVEGVRCPKSVDVWDTALGRDDLANGFATCIGTLIALHRRLRGERVAAPPLRRRGRALSAVDLRSKRPALIGVTVALAIALMAALFGVRAAQLAAAERIIDTSRPLLDDLERLQEEVDVLQFERGRQRSVLDTVRALTDVLPSDVKVETLAIDAKGKITVTGTTRSVEAASDKAIAAMEASKQFTAPKFLGVTKQKEEFGFRITCELGQGPGGSTP